jgi:hypothetical protein
MPVDSRVTFSLQNTEAADDNAVVVVSCYDVSLPGYNCYGADVVFQHFFPTPTFTPTPTATPLPDSDGDGVPDTYDNCPNAANPGQENRDANFIDLHVYGKLFDDTTRVMSDAFGDACDPDDTFPGTSCPSGQPASTYMTHEDTDGDRVIDSAECAMGTNPDDALSYPPPMPAGDADHDALPDVWETAHGTDPANPDTDGDRLLDGVEVLYYDSSPRIADTDGDGCSDGKEAASLNNDLTVNSTDQLMVAQTFSNAGSTKYVVDFDVNKDGRINSTDMLVQAKVYGPC